MSWGLEAVQCGIADEGFSGCAGDRHKTMEMAGRGCEAHVARTLEH